MYIYAYIYAYIYIYEHKFRWKSLSMSYANIVIDVYKCMKKYTQVCLYIYIYNEKKLSVYIKIYTEKLLKSFACLVIFIIYKSLYIYVYVFETPYVNIMTSGTLAKQDGTATFICSSHPHGSHFNTVYNIKT